MASKNFLLGTLDHMLCVPRIISIYTVLKNCLSLKVERISNF
jgi:hypothetical protein